MSLRLLITTPLEPELIERLASQHPGVEVVYPSHLIPPPRYPAEHRYPDPGTMTASELDEWEALLASADILLDFGPAPLRDRLSRRPRLRWIQATSAGIGPLAGRLGLDREEGPVVTTASGVHAGPIAEFVLLAMLWFRKDLPGLLRRQSEHRWERLAMGELRGSTATVVGLGRVGTRIAENSVALGMEVLGCGHRPRSGVPIAGLRRYFLVDELDDHLPGTDFLVLCLPETESTRGLLDARRLAKLAPSAVVINVGRGSAIDEQALIEVLRQGQLGGAALDVVSEEPLAPESPLWELPNVLLTPHSVSTAPAENGRIVDLLDDNLTRFEQGREPVNRLDLRLGY